MKRVLFLTGYTDNYLPILDPDGVDDTMGSVYETTLPSKLKYVEKHGYDFLSIRNFGQEKTPAPDEKFNNPTRDLGFIRITRTLQMLQFYDVVMWIDADSLLTNQDVSVDDIIGEHKEPFIASHDWSRTSYISSGNFIVQNTDKLDEFSEIFYNIAHAFPEEQSTINFIHSDPKNNGLIKIVDHKFLNSVPTREMYGECWNSRGNIICNWTDESFLLHLTGVTNKIRHQILTDYFGKFL